MHMTSKDRRAKTLQRARLMGQTEGMGKIKDWKNQKAKEAFLRPAFKGTELEKKHD